MTSTVDQFKGLCLRDARLVTGLLLALPTLVSR